MQWNVREYTGGRDVTVRVPGDEPLHIPAGFAENQEKFDAGLDAMNDGLRDAGEPEAVNRALRRIAEVKAEDADALADTFAHLQVLYHKGRNGIWTFVLRAEMKGRLRAASDAYGLWVGGKPATQQDICAASWARCAERWWRHSWSSDLPSINARHEPLTGHLRALVAGL